MAQITTSTGTTVRIADLSFLGRRVIIDHPDAPSDIRNVEVGLANQGHLQFPGTEFGMSPEVLRAIADLLEGDTE